MNRMNIIIGSVGIAREDGAASIEYYVLHPANDHVCNLFYGHLFSSNLFQQALIGIGYGILSHRMRIPFESLKKELLPFPPLHEQERIASFLDKQFLLLNNLVEKLKLQISKLREAREVLISDAVTGKIDVRDYVNLEDISTRKLEAGI